MIPQRLIDNYLSEPSKDTLTWLKTLKPLEVEMYLADIQPRHTFTIPTFRIDQKINFIAGVAFPYTMYMSDLGLGKTGVSLELLTYFMNNGFVRRTFVFAPTEEIAEGWVDEINKWGFKLPYCLLTRKTTKQKWAALEGFSGNGLVIGTYIGISAMVSSLVITIDRLTHLPTGKRKRKVDFKQTKRLLVDVDAVVYDQSTALGNKGSLSYKVCKEVSGTAQIRFSLAGRAFGRDAYILWSQMFLTDKGKSLGDNAGIFREAYWRKENPNFPFSKWVLRKRREKDLANRIAVSSLRWSTDECLELPQKTQINKYCEMPDENWAYYDQVKQELLKAHGNYTEVKSHFIRMRQISSGFIGFKDDETGEKASLSFEINPKLELLMELIEELPEDKKMIIFHEFTYSGSTICAELMKRKLKHGWLWGGTKDWTDIKNKFNTDPDYRILVLNHRKGGMGLNLQAANYCIYYESPVSSMIRYECDGRIRRDGQKHPCFYYDLLMKDTVDEHILELHKDGADIYKVLVENPQKIIKGI